MTNYNFGEKIEEKWKNSKTNQLEDLKVWQTPKYLQSKTKAIELISDGKYCLDEGDFWILKNKGGSKLCYTGLIISHNGCLKINHKLDKELQFKPSCVSFVKDEAEKIKVMQYISDEQGVYEFGEISPKNCMNDYPYAMVLKRLMDRVILKNSKVGFFGIYSDSESEDFKEKLEPKEEKPKNQFSGMAETAEDDMKATLRAANEASFRLVKSQIEAANTLEEMASIWSSQAKEINKLKKYTPDLYKMLVDSKEFCKSEMQAGMKMANDLGDNVDYSVAG